MIQRREESIDSASDWSSSISTYNIVKVQGAHSWISLQSTVIGKNDLIRRRLHRIRHCIPIIARSRIEIFRKRHRVHDKRVVQRKLSGNWNIYSILKSNQSTNYATYVNPLSPIRLADTVEDHSADWTCIWVFREPRSSAMNYKG